jgi:hypothetical protein
MSATAAGRISRRAFLAAGWAAVLLATACGDAFGPTSRLADARQRWRRTRPEAYRYQLVVGCFCALPPQPVTIEVRGDAVLSAVDAQGAPVRAPMASTYGTIDDLFEVIARAIAADAVQVDVSYDPTRGYPTSIAIDGSTRVADDEVGYTVSGFVAH